MKECNVCGETKPVTAFRKRTSQCKTCCSGINSARRRTRYAQNPLLRKANTVINGLQWGRGGGARMMDFINLYLATNCVYCGNLLELKNMSLDHKTPLPHAARKESKRTGYSLDVDLSPAEIVRLNSEANLHFVCLTCNRAKGNLTHEEYLSLLDFLEDKPRMKQIVIAKLKGSNFMYRKY